MLLLAALATLQTPATAQPYTNRLVPTHVGGRIIQQEDGGASFGWPGIYFEGRFRGTAVRVRFESLAEHMRLFIDGDDKLLSKKVRETDVIIRGLPLGDHVVRLEKLTESQSGGGRFLGFFTDGEPLPIRPRAKQIEFIGDSYTVGYGNTSGTRTCPGTMVHDTTDTQQSFGPLLAKRLDADYRMNAYSGFGIVRNYSGGEPDLSLPAIYPRLKPDDPAAIERSQDGWRPQLIVINLGTNDFSTPLKAGERWKTEADLKAAYRARYVAFVGSLRQRYSGAHFILMGSDAFVGEVVKVASELKGRGEQRVSTIRFTGLDLLGCDHHPSLADQKIFADLLQHEIARLRIW